MNPTPHHDDERHEALSLGPAEKADGFAAVMKRLKSHSEQERAQLRAQADAAILGHEAYALGHDNLRRGNYVAAKRWLRVAADHSVPGVEQALEEIEAGLADDLARPVTVEVTADAAPCPTGASHAGTYELEKWASLLQNWTEAGLAVDAARAQAQQIIAQARRTADEVIAKAREEADRAWADARNTMAAEHRAAAELLREAERLQQDARLLVQKALRAAEPVINERPFPQALNGETRQLAQAFAAGRRTDGLRSEQRQQPPLPVNAGATVRTVVASADADAGTPLKFGLSTCINETPLDTWRAWLHNLLEACSQARDNLPERSETCGAGWLRRHSAATPADLLPYLLPPVLVAGSMRFGTEVRPVGDIDFVLAHGVVRLGPEFQSAHEAASSGSPRGIARWVTAGNEVALATSNAEHQRGEACLKILWVTEACEEVVDENDTASDIVSVEESAHVAPR
ncbi:hypothetical protein ACFYWH_44700 [Streptomyces sp. NPDC003737]|uniref:hypothetical protein n=1 Tax=Streptomyces sp. NPDC003737 TaxID=3364685 RepID=UPI003673CFD2